jgi:hypothetical protein
MLLPVTGTAQAAPVELQGNHITITGDERDFSISSGGNMFFDIPAMLPGEETDRASLTIQNTQDLSFTVQIGVTAAGSDSDLLALLNVVVYLDGHEIANFPAKGQAGATNPYSIGRIPAGRTTHIEVGIEFPPYVAGVGGHSEVQNVMQTKGVHIAWRIVAVSDQPETPPTPTPAPSTPTGTVVGGAVFDGAVPDTTLPAANVPAPAAPADTTASSTPSTSLPDLVNIDDTETPLDLLEEDAWALLNLILTIGCVLIVGAVLVLRARRSSEEGAEKNAPQPGGATPPSFPAAASSEAESLSATDEQQRKRSRLLWRVFCAVAAVVAIVLFIFTEDITKPLAIVDRWTITHVVIFVLGLAFLLVSLRRPAQKGDSAHSSA